MGSLWIGSGNSCIGQTWARNSLRLDGVTILKYYQLIIFIITSLPRIIQFCHCIFTKVSRLNGSYRMPLISHDLEKPRAIVLYPYKGLMFWSDWGETPKIESAHMDGSQRKILMSNKTSFIYWPNGLTIDYETNMLYWIDGRLNLVGRMGLNGGMYIEYVYLNDEKFLHLKM